MSHITLAQQGITAAEAKNWDEAITKLSTALQSSNNPTWLLTRSKALVNKSRYREALDDADLAWHTAYERNKRPLMVEAHYRRAVAYFRLGELANADCCCVYAMRLIKGFPAVEKEDPSKAWTDANGLWKATREDAANEAKTDEINERRDGGIGEAMGGQGHPQAREWRQASTLRIQILTTMDKLPADADARKITATHKPNQKKLADVSASQADTPSTTASAPAPQPAQKPTVPSDTPVRLQEFQSNTTMSVSIFSKGNGKDQLKVEFSPTSIRLDPLVYPSGEQKEFVLDVWGEIDTAASKYTVTPNKVELSLAKKTPGKWAQLKADGSAKPPQQTPAAPTPAAAPAPTPSAPSAAYPTSSKTGPKDWDALAGSDDEDDSSDVNKFFKDLYKKATPEQQRAMMKSFTESNGTSLSTDWGDVKDRKVDTVPPEGVQAKKW